MLTRTVRRIGLCLALLLAVPQECLAQQQDLQEGAALHRQVMQLYNQGRYAQAIPLAERVLVISERALGPEHPSVATWLHTMAALYVLLGDSAKAGPLLLRSLTIREKTLGPEHPQVAASLNDLALVYRALGDSAKAEPLSRRSLAIREKALGLEHPDVAQSLNSLALLYQTLGDYAKAEPLYRRSLAIREKALGLEHPDVAQSLNNLALLYHALGDSAKAEPLSRRSLAIREKALGPEHPNVAQSLNSLAALYEALGDSAKAEPLYRRSLAIREKALGSQHPDVAASLNNLAALYRALGDYAKAEPLSRRSLATYEKALGPEHPDVATSLNNLAAIYRALGDSAKAEPLSRRSLAIREKALGSQHPDVAASLNNLAALYRALGDYAKAEPLSRRSLAIREKALGPEHPDVAQSLNSLALLYEDLGDYQKAEPLYRRSVAIREKALGQDHPDVAASLNNLAALYYALGDYQKAEPLYRRSVAIREKALGPEHPDVAQGLNNLAALYKALGDSAKAEPLYRRSLAILEKALGPQHPDVAASLNNLALLYHALGDYQKAEPLSRRSLAILEKALGPEHANVATSLNSLAVLYKTFGDSAKAEPLYRRSLAILEKALGPEHPNVAGSLNNLATLAAAKDDFQGAHALFRRAQAIDGKLIEAVLGFTSEDQKLSFLATRSAPIEAFLSLVSQHLVSASSRKDALDVWLQRKGVILEAQKRFQDALVYADNPEAMQVFQALAALRARLSQLVFSAPGKEGPDRYRERIAALEKEKGELEARLSRLSQAFATRLKTARADTAQVARALPPHTVLIDFARVDIRNFKAKGTEKLWLPARYLTFVLHAGPGDRVALLDLGDAEAIDRLVARFKSRIASNTAPDRQDALVAARELHAKVFVPLQRELGSAKEIYIAPDGNLNLLPFEVLQGPDGKFLIEDYTFYYLGSGRDLLGFGTSQRTGGKALLIGDPNFDLGREEKASTLRQLALAETTDAAGAKRSTDLRGLHFARLPGTRQEVRAIHALLGAEKADLFTDKAALEEVLRQHGTPRILHLATHGFFLSDQDLASLRDDDRGMRQSGAGTAPPAKAGKIENPLVRSGFALAGANRALAGSDLGQSDGLVTAEKILGLRLRGTDLVVLSACETGLGDVKNGEGVFGLRRAFTQAGAKSLVMSMWAVPDRETQELMVAFYTNMLSGTLNRAQALRQAALSQMQVVKARHGDAHPFFWGAFVFLGEPSDTQTVGKEAERQAAVEREIPQTGVPVTMEARPSVSTANEIRRGGRFIAYDNGTVLDTSTNLMWAAKDNGSDINWANAKSYCEDYRGGGYTDWRMPTQDELAGLYDANKSRPGACNRSLRIHVATDLIDITCFIPWASETRGSDAASFDFSNRTRYWNRQSYTNSRALPVRFGK